MVNRLKYFYGLLSKRSSLIENSGAMYHAIGLVEGAIHNYAVSRQIHVLYTRAK